jgi:H+/Cl- antiporter ClcA
LGTGSFIIGLVCALVAFIYQRIFTVFSAPNYMTVVLVVIAFLIGLILSIVINEVIESGTATTFVCLAEDPAALQRNNPELFERIRTTYPEITWA